MKESAGIDTRARLIVAAADLVATSPGEDFSLRAVCDVVGVTMPTLYHFFGSKQGLIDAVIEHGFDMYVGEKSSMQLSGDPIQDIRAGWDAHVTFGLANPGFYSLMYGQVKPGHVPTGQSRPSKILLELTTKAVEQGRLVVSAEEAAAHILVTNIGLTLRQIILAAADPDLSLAVREGVIAAITGTGTHTGSPFASVIEDAASRPDVLGRVETELLIEWLTRLNRTTRGGKLPANRAVRGS